MNFHVIKEDDLFFLSNLSGIVPDPQQDAFGYGLYTQDTRMLSRLEWKVEPDLLIPLDADISGNYHAVYRYTNREVQAGNANPRIERETLFAQRDHFVDGQHFYETVTVDNYGSTDVTLNVLYTLGADFRDMFEVRGFAGPLPERVISVMADPHFSEFSYRATDGVENSTRVQFFAGDFTIERPVVEKVNMETLLQFSAQVKVKARQTAKWVLVIEPGIKKAEASGEASGDAADPLSSSLHTHDTTYLPFSENVLEAQVRSSQSAVETRYKEWFDAAPVVTGNKDFERWYERGLLDLRMLLTDIGYGAFPVAGVPWFAVPFGRDSLIAASQLLPVHPEVAKATLLTLAASQGTAVIPERDEQPGKIMHELRKGELTRTGLLPFGPYYGTIDATPLFINLAADYWDWTGDKEFLERLLPHIKRAFDWIEQYGDRDADGFVEYYREATNGIANQGWKDSGDSIVHKDGLLASGSIALSEVQGYVYRAYMKWSTLFAKLGDTTSGIASKDKAKQLQERFITQFWIPGQSSIALALDGEKRQVASLSSNMGQVLWSGILPQDYADKVIDHLLATGLFSGYGIRTLSTDEVAFNPLSYHNGSIWPHDNSLIVLGLERYGHSRGVSMIANGLLTASRHFELGRLPELFAGFGDHEMSRPVPYPVSCSPQAWAAGTPISILQALLGLQPDACHQVIHLSPELPPGVNELLVQNIRIGEGVLDICLQRMAGGETTFAIQRNTSGWPVQLQPYVRR